ncbi:hypothetical protein GGS20DRAFT_376047 [Poronia punctata]|nr:hypothetical protein GGS20DRAFT_376047 [Poronia punctata]
MATNPYEVEHGIKSATEPKKRRRVDMATFTSHLHQIQPDPSSRTASSRAGPTPVDMAGLFQLVQDQFATLATDSPSDTNRDFLTSLLESIQADVESPPDRLEGVDETYLADLDRVPRKKLQDDPEGQCMICAEKFLDDPYPLVVKLPCHGPHIFDLECVGPWLLSKGTCPACRYDLKKKKVEIPKDEEEDEDVDGLYG